MQIINSPTCAWTYLHKHCLQDQLQKIPSWEYGLVTSNLCGGPLNLVTLHHGLRHVPDWFTIRALHYAHPSAQTTAEGGRGGHIYLLSAVSIWLHVSYSQMHRIKFCCLFFFFLIYQRFFQNFGKRKKKCLKLNLVVWQI